MQCANKVKKKSGDHRITQCTATLDSNYIFMTVQSDSVQRWLMFCIAYLWWLIYLLNGNDCCRAENPRHMLTCHNIVCDASLNISGLIPSVPHMDVLCMQYIICRQCRQQQQLKGGKEECVYYTVLYKVSTLACLWFQRESLHEIFCCSWLED